MHGAIVGGCAALLVAAGCGSSSAKADGGGANGGGGGSGGAGLGGGGTGGMGTGGVGTGGTGTGGTAGPRTVTFASDVPLVFAVGQDGDGAWRPLTAGTGQSYTLQVTGGRYGIAYGCPDTIANSLLLTIVYATVAETTRVTVACGTVPAPAYVNVTIAFGGLSGTETGQVDFASSGTSVTAAMPTYQGLFPGGTHDLFARRFTTTPTFDRMIRRNDVAIVEGSSLNLDFGAEGFAPETRMVTFQGLTASESIDMIVTFRDAGGSPLSLGSTNAGSYLAIPAGQLRSGDTHSVVASAISSPTVRRVRRLFSAPMNFTAVFPALPPAATAAVGSTTPYIRPRITFPPGLDADRFDVRLNQIDNGAAHYRYWTLQWTRGWLASSGAVDYTVPDLSGVSGFQSWWGLVAGLATNFQQFANWSDAGAADLLRADQTGTELDGREYKIAQRLGAVTF